MPIRSTLPYGLSHSFSAGWINSENSGGSMCNMTYDVIGLASDNVFKSGRGQDDVGTFARRLASGNGRSCCLAAVVFSQRRTRREVAARARSEPSGG